MQGLRRLLASFGKDITRTCTTKPDQCTGLVFNVLQIAISFSHKLSLNIIFGIHSVKLHKSFLLKCAFFLFSSTRSAAVHFCRAGVASRIPLFFSLANSFLSSISTPLILLFYHSFQEVANEALCILKLSAVI